MPFKSKAQARYMFAKMPETAKKWAEHTPNLRALPDKLGRKAPRVKRLKRML